MRTEIYKGCEIRSTPHELTDQGDYKYSVNGIIQVDTGSSVTDIMIQNLAVPDDEWKHINEDDADKTFTKYAKEYIDQNILIRNQNDE